MKNINTHNVVLTILSLATLSLALPATSHAGPFSKRTQEQKTKVRKAIFNASLAALGAYSENSSPSRTTTYSAPVSNGNCNSQHNRNNAPAYQPRQHNGNGYQTQQPVTHYNTQPQQYTQPRVAPQATLSQVEQEVLIATNQVRAQYGLSPLQMSSPATRLSRAHSRSMARASRLTHDGMVQRLQSSAQSMGIRNMGGAENVIQGFGGPNAKAVAAELVRLWMNSPGHRRNILSANARYLGVGLATGSNGYLFGTQLFLN